MPYEAFPTKDGRILLGGGNDRLYGVLCRKINQPQWIADPRFVTNSLRIQNRGILVPMIADITKSKTTQVRPQPLSPPSPSNNAQEWLEILEGCGMPYASINDIQTTLAHDHVRARGMVQTVEHPTVGPIRLVNTPVKYSEATPGIRTPPPTLGQHTDEVLQELGLTGEEIGRLRGEGVVA